MRELPAQTAEQNRETDQRWERMMDWISENWMAIAAVIGGIVVCTFAGLLALTPDPERPARFLPVYLIALLLFLLGLSLILWCESVHEWPQVLENL